MNKFIVILICLIGFHVFAFSQFVTLKDSLLYFEHDTSLIPLNLFDSASYTSQEPAEPEIEKSLRSYWQKEFIRMISVNEPEKGPDVQTAAEYYEKYRGKIIRNINIKQLEVFGQTVADTTHKPTTWIQNLGNELHINTQEQSLREKLLIQPGDSLNPFILADNERLIRNLPYIKNVQVLVTEIENDSIDLLFITKDVFPIGFGLEIFDISYGQAGIWNKNLLGVGHEFYYHLLWNYNKSQNFGHRVKYRIQNIGNTFITVNIDFENTWRLKAYKIYMNRNFLTPEMKYAGGLGFEDIKSTIDIELKDTTLLNSNLNYNYIDLWMGRSVLLTQAYRRKKRSSIALTGRIMRYNFQDRPAEVSADYLHDYHIRTIILGGIGISSQVYKKSYLVYGFGKPEDIPYGFLATFTAGLEKSEYVDRPYLGFAYSFGAFGTKFGLLYYKIQYGTFFNEGTEQGTFKFMFHNFSPLFNKEGRYNYRLFTKINYKTGINRFEDEFIQFENNTNIRGLTSQNMKGSQLFNIKFETVCYSPHYFLGFRFLYYLFVDGGLINFKNKLLINNPVYSGFGAGIRIRNENLVFNTIELRFSYYPVVPENSSTEYIRLSGIDMPKPESFIIPKPEVLDY